MNGDFRVGDFLVEPEVNTISRAGAATHIEPKIMQVLVCLADNAGNVVAKEKLIRSVWADTFVTDDVLTRSISELRRVFADDPREPRFIQTITRSGYRLIAPVSSDGEGPRAASELTPAHPVSSPPSWRRRALISSAALSLGVIIAMAAIAYFIIRGNPRANPVQQPPQLSRLTLDAGLQAEPTWSPDGRFIAYSSDKSGNLDIWVQSVGGGDPVQVTHSPATDWQPDWSPDGSQIVFRSERDDGGLFVVPALGGRERKISKFGYKPKWSPDGNKILFSNNLGGATKVYLVTLDGNPPQEVLSELLSDFDLISSNIIWHPDGQRISLWGRKGGLEWGFWTTSPAGGTPVRSELDAEGERFFEEQFGLRFHVSGPSPVVRDVGTLTFRWAPSGRALYFGGISQGVSNLWKITVDPQTLRWVATPERLTTGLDDTDVAVSPDGGRLAFTQRNHDIRAWTLPFDARTGKVTGEGQPVTRSGRQPGCLNLSPDGKRLLYGTFVPGTNSWELREKSLADGRDVLLTEEGNTACWSHDGTRIAYLTARSPSRDGRVIVVLPATGGDEQDIAFGASDHVSDWSADGQWLLATTDRPTPGRWSALALYPLAAAPHAEAEMRVLTSRAEYMPWNGRFSPDGRWVCFNAVTADWSSSDVYVVPSSGGEWIRVTEAEGWADKTHWSPDGKTIYFLTNRGTGWWNVWGIRFDPQQGKPVGDPFQVTSFDSPGKSVWSDMGLVDITLSADRLVLPLMEETGNVWVLDMVDR